MLIVDADRALGGLWADVIGTHCPGMRIDVCAPTPDEREPLHDNAGGADVVVCSCGGGSGAGNRFDTLRELLTLRPCLAVVVLIPADLPALADEAIAAGATDVLLRAPGYLEQLPIAVRKNVAKSRAAIAAEARAERVRAEMITIRGEIALLRADLNEASAKRRTAVDRPRGMLPLPVITRTHGLARAA